jgi:hypothetical protein
MLDWLKVEWLKLFLLPQCYTTTALYLFDIGTCPANREITVLELRCRLSLVPVLCQLNPLHALTVCFFTNYTNYLRFKVCKSVHHRTFQINHQPDATIFQHDCHHDTNVKPEAATAVIELLMMGGTTPETCWAVNKRQDNELKKCCIRLVIYLDYTNYLM